MSSHHFHNLHPAMRSRRSSRTFNHFGDVSERSIEAQRVVGSREIFVDGLRHAHDRNSSLGEDSGNSQRVFTAARDERIEPESLDILDDLMRSILRMAFF